MVFKVYKRGDKNDPMINRIQNALVAHGLLSNEDVVGTFGPKTERAVIAYQKRENLIADGIVGQTTLAKLGLLKKDPMKGLALTNDAVAKAAQELGVETALMHAFAEVESNGRGYHSDGTIKILYERHIFRRQALSRGLKMLEKLVSDNLPDICNKVPGGYIGGVAENIRLETAVSVHREVGYESASYGRFQLMGFRYAWCGFSSAEEMYNTLVKGGEDAHLQATVNFIKAQPLLLNAMRQKDFLQMALNYNGPAQQGYDRKLEQAYNRYKELYS